MPLPSDKKIIALGEDLLKQFDAIFGFHPGFRPVHAKGMLVTGTFTPSPEAASLTRAPHITRSSTPVTVRFSNFTGIPVIPDNDPNANPHGMAIRFHLAEHVHTDIVSHSIDGFPVRTAEEFLEMLQAIASSNSPNPPSPLPVEVFMKAHPVAFAFAQPRPVPASFATEPYFAISAFRFIDKDGVGRYGRYRIVPNAGTAFLDDETAKNKGQNFLFEDLAHRIATGPISFQIMVQIANEKDIVNDATVHWPEDRRQVNLGKIELTAMAPEEVHEQKTIIFDPIPRVDGIEPSDDPLFEVRAAVYLLSGRRRRQAPDQ